MIGSTLSNFGLSKRLPINSNLINDKEFMSLFDDTTFFYDLVRVSSGEGILICPPIDITLSRRALEAFGYQILESQSSHMITKIKCRPPRDFIYSEQTQALISMLSTIKPERILYTLQQDNLIEWIADWIVHHKNFHHADFVIIYDNSSRSYPRSELCMRLSSIDIPVFVMSANYKYGPSGSNQKRDWGFDDMYLQSACLEHVNACVYASNAPTNVSILNLDIDEILSPFLDDLDIFAKAAKSPEGYTRFFGINAYMNKIKSLDERPAHADHTFLDTYNIACPAKYCFSPHKVSLDTFLTPHRAKSISKWDLDLQYRMIDADCLFVHCRGINTGWKEPLRSRGLPTDGMSSICNQFPYISKEVARIVKEGPIKKRLMLELPGIYS